MDKVVALVGLLAISAFGAMLSILSGDIQHISNAVFASLALLFTALATKAQ